MFARKRALNSRQNIAILVVYSQSLSPTELRRVRESNQYAALDARTCSMVVAYVDFEEVECTEQPLMIYGPPVDCKPHLQGHAGVEARCFEVID